jgi:hypothetical protein
LCPAPDRRSPIADRRESRVYRHDIFEAGTAIAIPFARKKEDATMSKRNITVLVTFLMLFAMACGSMNRATPKQWDNKVIEADVRSKIAEKVTSKTFAVEVTVNHQVVTLSGHAASEADRRAIGDAAQSVNGVTTVINNITVQ